MVLLRRVLLGFVVLLALLGIAGATYQWLSVREEMRRFPAPGQLLEVDGLTMHIDCRGSGRPVILMEAGLTTGSWSWGRVPEALGAVTEVCAYDRPGMGWSDPVDHLTDAVEVAGRLHRLVQVAGIDGPYVLLGMSAGGVYVRQYYDAYPDDVIGMVLVDSSHEQQGNRLPQLDDAGRAERMLGLCRWLQPFGVVRLSGALESLVERPGIALEDKPLLLAVFNRTGYCSATLNEMRGFAAEIRRAEPPAGLGDLPLLVLSQGREPEADETFGVTLAQARAMRTVWNELQLELTALSSRGRRFVAEHSGHPIQLDQPELVIDTVSELVRSLREPPALSEDLSPP